MNKTQFQEAYQFLNEVEKAMVKLLALGFEEIRQSHLYQQLNAAEVRTEKGTKFNNNNIKEYLKALSKKGWVEVGVKNTYQLPKDRLYFATVLTVTAPDFPIFKQAFLPKPADLKFGYWYYGDSTDLSKELRLAFFTQDEKRFRDLLYIAQTRFQSYEEEKILELFQGPVDFEWLSTVSLSWQVLQLDWLLLYHYYYPSPNDELLRFLKQHPKINTREGSGLRSYLNQLLLFRGDHTAAQALLAQETETWRNLGREVMLLVLKGEDNQATKLFPQALKAFRKAEGNSQEKLTDLTAALYLLALLRQRGKSYATTIKKYAPHTELFGEFMGILFAINIALSYQQNALKNTKELLQNFQGVEKNIFDWMAYGWCSYWLDETPTKKDIKKLEELAEASLEHQLDWFALEFSSILSYLHPNEKQQESWRNKSKELQQKTTFLSFIHAVPKLEPWERALEFIATLGESKKRATKQAQKRLVWLVDFEHEMISPKEQQLNKSGQWTSGRKVALKRLKSGKVDGIQQQDAAIIKVINEQGNYHNYYYSNELFIPFDSGIIALIGHPHVYFHRSPTVGIELVSRSLQLLLEETEEGFLLKFNYEWDGSEVILNKETPTRYGVIESTDLQQTIREQIENGLKIPARARKKIEQTVEQLSRIMPVTSSLLGGITEIPTQEANTDIVVHLLPMGDGFKIEFFVKPFQSEPPYVKPGLGQDKVFSEIGGKKRMAQRRLDREANNAQKIIGVCPSLQHLPAVNYEWVFDEAVACLNVLLELHPLRDSGQITIEHPKGEPIRLAGTMDFDKLSLQVQKERDWFALDGTLQINDHEVIRFRELLEKAAATDNHFIQLNDGQYIALTEAFRRKLRELDAVLHHKGKQLQLHPLAGEMLDDVSDLLADFEEDIAWKETKRRLAQAKKVQATVPSTFQAELRPYQMDGFKWLMQMAAWGVGACLADDMGLGKTIQALAVLVARAEMGPAMVIAPASVTRNWLRETQKFAPTLRPQLLGGGDRAAIIENLGPYDLLLVSYGLLPIEAKSLAAKNFATIILDEAQAIKNRTTKRAKAAKTLQADFRLITTGTPIENHLGELWSLFHFLNPGFLGTIDHFNQRFAVPIERYGDQERRMQLRRLLQAFILRRRKNDVLQELPSKTEINLNVELSTKEMAFYEALRQRAIEEIEAVEGPQKRFQILGQLTRLRQAACHPQLVDESLALSSSKLELVGETILELLDNGHKALIFSQFVKHLRLIENWVKAQNIAYQYLDGQTPGKKRDEAVQAFQRGEGELFLISLKAGGTGLNLTAADYVLHLDPWWNPAVEDQASDRAHRIGQQRPVTVYRFISEHTIEEKIVQLHHDKRDLADNLLAGTESSASLSADELVSLIRGT